jgi:hypothetical protein
MVLGDLKNGDLMIGMDRVFILDNETLEIKQEFTQEAGFEYTTQFASYFDPISNQSTFYVGMFGSGSIHFQLTRDSNGKYSMKPMFASQMTLNKYKLFLTGLTTGVSTDECEISYWRNFDSVLDRTRDQKYMMEGRISVAVSYDEKTFVLRSDNNQY